MIFSNMNCGLKIMKYHISTSQFDMLLKHKRSQILRSYVHYKRFWKSGSFRAHFKTLHDPPDQARYTWRDNQCEKVGNGQK